MKCVMYSCMLACCLYGCMCMLYVACDQIWIALSGYHCLNVVHAFITVHFGKRSRLFSFISVCNRSRLFLLL
ncbi:hypothetical protein AMTRI_Chr08g165750 [Amborella trichopoda]